VKSIYITSVDRYSGKTAMCLALGRYLQSKGKKVGYMKPVGMQPWRVGKEMADEDAAFIKEVLNLPPQAWEISPIVVTKELLCDVLTDKMTEDTLKTIKDASKKLGKDVDVMIYEGGGSLREGYVVGLPTPKVAEELGSEVLALVKFRGRVMVMDDALAAKTRLGDSLKGIIINRVPADRMEFVTEFAVPYLEKVGIPVFGILPETRGLEAVTVKELLEVIKGKELTTNYDPEAIVEVPMVGAMTAEAALHRFRKQTNKAVITGGDRSDILLAALETSTTCLILTGNLQPSPLIIKQAEDMGVAVFLVNESTLETVERIEKIFGKTGLGQVSKLKQFEDLLDKHVDLKKIFKAFDLKI
jgi:BioD-like phosphotransacetylase family protein